MVLPQVNGLVTQFHEMEKSGNDSHRPRQARQSAGCEDGPGTPRAKLGQKDLPSCLKLRVN